MRGPVPSWLPRLLVLALAPAALAAGAEPDLAAQGISGRRPVAARLADAREVRTRLGLTPEYASVSGIETVKVAVLDYGFDGANSGRPYLPENAVVVEHYDPEFVRRNGLGDPGYHKAFEPGNRHGRAMAQIIWAVAGSHPRGPQFYLLNASGPTMLRRAVRYAIEQDVDIILFSGSFEGVGDGDGRGPINRIVADALAAGIIWINAAGNYRDRVYNGPVHILNDGYLRLRDVPDIAALRFRNRLDENTITVTLSWNDFRDEEDAGTTKDLDLYVEDWTGRRVGASEKVQIAGDRVAGPEESRNPRERIVLANLPASPDLPGDPDCSYRIRVRVRGGAFGAEDRIRILVTAQREAYLPPGGEHPVEALEFLDASGSGELFPPADHPLILTVGDDGPASSVGPTADHRVKPDVLIEDSRAFFTDGEVTAGSSNAAAYFAGVVAVLKAAAPSLDTRDLLRLATRGVALASDHRSSTTAASSRARIDVVSSRTTAGGSLLTRSGAPSGSSTRLSTPPPASVDPRPALPESLRRRIWRTPTRAELSATLRSGP